MSKKKYTVEEVADILYESSEEEDFSPSESSYKPSSNSGNSKADGDNTYEGESDAFYSESDEEYAADDINSSVDEEEELCENEVSEAPAIATWTNIIEDGCFEPKFRMPLERDSQVLVDLPRGSTEFRVFREFFPKSLCIFIAQCTNQRLKKLNKEKKTNRALTDEHEIMVFLGVAMIMHYNHLPSLHDYWSKHASMGNEMIKQSISRDRFTLLSSKLYLNDCDKPDNAPKDYYISEVVSCMKEKFMRIRSDSPFQSIDECMAKFKGRSSLKQYMPMKPIKRGVKIWLRCDAKTGYTYDLNVYTGKDVTTNLSGTLGERVVLKLAGTIRDNDVAVAFDRFFTSITLMKSIPFPAIGTYMRNRKETPKFGSRIERGQSQFPRTELLNIGDHLPLKDSSRRRCVRCTSLQKETRTNYVCSGCNNALCFKCFASYHK